MFRFQMLFCRRLPFLAVLLLALLATGCYTGSRRLTTSAVRKITTNTTTRAEVEASFGRAPEAHSFPSGTTFVRYTYHRYIPSTEASAPHRRTHPGDVLLRTLTLVYDQNGRVLQKLHDESVTPIRRSWSGWTEVGPFLPPQLSGFIVHKGDPIERAIATLGEPMERWIWKDGGIAYIWYYYKDRADKLGPIESRRLVIDTDSAGRVIDSTLSEYNPRNWFRRGAW